ncbi:MAG: hypothetical protein ABJ314_06365, partial [Ilumatobacter sp.]
AMRPFWMHQLVEYIIGACFISTAIPSSTPIIPLVLGGLIIVNAAISTGPAGAFRLVHRQVHRLFDVALIGATVVASAQPVYAVQNSTRAIMLLLALVLGFVWWNTDFATRNERKDRRRGRSRTATGATGTAPRSDPSDTKVDPEIAGRMAGRSAAQTFLAAKRLKKAMIDDRNRSDSA